MGAYGEPKKQWWESDRVDDVHTVIDQTLAYYDKTQTYITEANLQHLKLYNNTDLRGFLGRQYAQMKQGNSTDSRATLNVTKSMCDTITAKITKNKPRVSFLTKEGDWTQQRKAKKLEKFVDGLFYSADVYRTMARCFLDCTIFGTGFMKVFPDYGEKKICVERVFPEEIVVDDEESRYEEPRTLYQWKLLSRDQVIADFAQGDPVKEQAILKAPRADDKFGKQRNWGRTDQIRVIEAWHKPSGPGAPDGKRAIVISNHTLVFEDWQGDFPFAVLRWKPKVLGYYGFGLAEEVAGLQREINKLMRRIQMAMHRLAVPRVYVEKGSDVASSKIRNSVGDIVHYTGQPPVVDTPQTVHPEVFSHLDRLWQRAYEIAGISQMSATGRKQSGLSSGVAIREMQDIETERFADVQQMYEEFAIDIAELCLRSAKDVAESEKGDFTVSWPGADFIQTIKWKDVSMEADQYVMQTFPTNYLSSTPAGKVQGAVELMQTGLINPEVGRSLITGIPDLDGAMGMQNAPVDNIKRLIENILDGKYQPPEPFGYLGLAIEMMEQAYLKAQNDGAPEEILESMRIWMKGAQDMLTPPQPPMAPGGQPPAPGGMAQEAGLPAEMGGIPSALPPVGAPEGERPLV